MSLLSRNVGLAIVAASIICLSGPAAKSQTPPSGPTGDASSGDDAETALKKAILAKEIISIVQGNISAADRENGEINKLIRALSGVSPKDIEQFGICGGPNAEVRKLLGSICGKI